MKGAQITNITKAREFALAGNSTFTVVSKASDKRYTFKIQKGKKPGMPHFVKYMNGSDNESSFQFIGSIFDEKTYRHSKKSTTSENATVVKTFIWIFNLINGKIDESKFSQIKFYHEGKCGKCGRKLTVPESIETGMGSTCAKSLKGK